MYPGAKTDAKRELRENFCGMSGFRPRMYCTPGLFSSRPETLKDSLFPIIGNLQY